MPERNDFRERPPSVDELARSLADTDLPHSVLVEVARTAIAESQLELARENARRVKSALLQPVINATGVLLHTNLGRAPIELRRTSQFTNLELDLESGRRGNRQRHCASLMNQLVGSEDTMVVNNGAGALFLVLAALAHQRSVVVSRGEARRSRRWISNPGDSRKLGGEADRGRNDQSDQTVGLQECSECGKRVLHIEGTSIELSNGWIYRISLGV